MVPISGPSNYNTVPVVPPFFEHASESRLDPNTRYMQSPLQCGLHIWFDNIVSGVARILKQTSEVFQKRKILSV